MNAHINVKKLGKNSINMINGATTKNIIAFALPVMLTSLLQMLFNSADLAVVGQFAQDSNVSLAAVGAAAPVVALLINFFIGISVGSNIIIAQLIGAKDENTATKAVHNSILLALILGVVSLIIGLFLSEKILILMGCKNEILSLATQYLTIIICGSPFTLLYNFSAAILRTKGDTKRPFIFLTIAGVINVLLNLFFVIVFHLDVVGVALATVISKIFAAAAVLIVLFKEDGYCKISIKKLKFNKTQFFRILTMGLPTALQSTCFSISNIFTKSFIIGLGDIYISSSTVQFNVQDTMVSVVGAMNQATIAFVAQNYGAKNYTYIKHIFKKCTFISTVIMLTASAFMVVFRRQLASIFSSEAEVLEIASLGILLNLPFYFIYGISQVASGVSNGMGSKTPPMVISLIFICLFRILYLIYILPINNSYNLLILIYPISWVLACMAQYIWYRYLITKTIKKHKLENILPVENAVEAQ